jgi:hypothetical protein
MWVAYKNFRSLNVDEAVVTWILRWWTNKNIEVFMPINSQMKDIDLVLMNMQNRKSFTVQVKWSRAYEPKKSEIKKYGDGSTGRFFLKKDIIQKSSADYFVFLIYVISEDSKIWRRTLEPHTLTIPTEVLKELTIKNKIPHPDNFSFLFRVNPKKKIAFDFREEKEWKWYDVSEYLDDKWIKKLNDNLW